MRFPVLHRVVVPAGLMALAACSSSSTAPGTFDAAAMNQSVQAVGGSFAAAPVQSFGSVGTKIDLALGTSLVTSTSPVSAFMTGADVPALTRAASRLAVQPRVIAGTSALLIPSAVLGTTFEWNVATTAYVAGTRAGAPTNGVRFILYTLDPVTKLPATPLTETGYAEMTQVVTGTSGTVRLVVVSSSVTYLDYSASISGTVTQPTYTVSGFVTDGTNRGNFTLANAFTATNTGGTANLTWSIAVPTKSVTFALGANVGVAGQASTFDLTSTITAPAGSVGLTGAFTSAAGGTLGVQVNNAAYATITVAAGAASTTATGPTGAALTAGQAGVVDGIFTLFKGAVDIAGDLIAPFKA